MMNNKFVDISTLACEMEDSFAEKLKSYMALKKMTGVECYTKSNLTKSTFSKIMNKKNYTPSKNTAICFALGLNLNIKETEDLLATLGIRLSHSNLFDILIEYFIRNGIYDIYEINEVLYDNSLPCLGAVAA